MDKQIKLLIRSIKIAEQHKGICLLGLVQIVSLYLVFYNLDSVFYMPVIGVIALGLVLYIFAFSTSLLWLTVKGSENKTQSRMPLAEVIEVVHKVFIICLIGAAVLLLFKMVKLHWTIFILVSSLIGSGIIITMVASVVHNLNLFKSLLFTLDFINQKITVASSLAFVIILANSYGYYFAHSYWLLSGLGGGFSVLQASATIWIVFVMLAVFAAFFSGVGNAWLVLLIINISLTSQGEEDLEPGVAQIAIS